MIMQIVDDLIIEYIGLYCEKPTQIMMSRDIHRMIKDDLLSERGVGLEGDIDKIYGINVLIVPSYYYLAANNPYYLVTRDILIAKLP